MFTKLNVQVLKHVSAYTELTNGHICVNPSSIRNRNYSSKSRQTSISYGWKKRKTAVLYFLKSENCYNKITSVITSCIWKSIKEQKTIFTCWKVWKNLGFDRESKRKLPSHISRQFEVYFMYKFFDFKKPHSEIMDFQFQQMYSYEAVVKVFVSKQWMLAEIKVTI